MQIPVKRTVFPGVCLSDEVTARIEPSTWNLSGSNSKKDEAKPAHLRKIQEYRFVSSSLSYHCVQVSL